MNIAVQDIVTLNERGQRERNEDSIFPEEHLISKDNTLFMVCDGVGGARGGDRASQLVCQHFSSYLLRLGDVYQTKEVLREALRYTEQCLDEYSRSYPEYEGMASTLTYLNLTNYGAVIAWVGDSRVLQIRAGRIIRQTKDHSLVNALLDYGEISREEAAVHPKRNVLLRAVSGAGEQGRIDVMYVDDIMPGDYFLLCSDGIIEGLGDRLEPLFAESFSMEQIKYDINRLCQKRTTDNYSMILLQIGEVTSVETFVEDLEWTVPGLQEEAPRSARVDGPDGPEGPPPQRIRPYLILTAIAVVILGGWWIQHSIPLALQVLLVGEDGVLIRDQDHTILIDAFPLSDKVREHQAFEPVRQAMLTSKAPFSKVELFLVSHRPNLEPDSVASFLKRYLMHNEQVQLHPEILSDRLEIGRSLFSSARQNTVTENDLRWQEGELTAGGLVERIPNPSTDSSSVDIAFSAFLLHLTNNKILLYAGDPNVDIDYLSGLEADIDYVLINEWNLRRGAARRMLAARFTDRQLIILPTDRAMNYRQREEIRLFFPGARFLTMDRERVKLK